MYKDWFFIENPVWNNEFSFEKRKNKKIFVPALIEVKNFDEIKLQDDKNKISFEDFDFNDKISTNYWLKNFYRFKIKNKELVLFDNHNHAFYFWYEARKKGIIWNKNILIHIDEHADTRDNNKFISRKDSQYLQKVFDFTNFVLNVWDYIIPAQKEGIISEIMQIRNTKNLEDYLENIYPYSKNFLISKIAFPEGKEQNPNPKSFYFGGEGLQEEEKILKNFELQKVGNKCIFPLQKEKPTNSSFLQRRGARVEDKKIILNLDLDFFQPDLDFIDFDLKKKVILDAFEKADFVTVCTSPFFVDQKLAIEVFKKIFSEKL